MIEMKKLKSSLFIVILQNKFLVVPFKGIKALSWSQKRCISTQHLKWAFTGRSYVIQGQLPTSMVFLWFKIHKGHVCYIHEMCEFVSTYLHIFLYWFIILKVPNVECKLLFMQNSKIILASHDKNLMKSNMIICYFVPFVGYIRKILYLIWNFELLIYLTRLLLTMNIVCWRIIILDNVQLEGGLDTYFRWKDIAARVNLIIYDT